MAERLRGHGPLIGLALVLAGAASVVLVFSLRIHGIALFDEYYTTVGGRYVSSHLPQSLWDTSTFFDRGPERLTALLAAVTDQLGPSTAADIRLLHVTQALCFAGAALPAYGLARTVGTDRRWALGAGVATVCVPWMLYGTTLLNAAPSFVLSTAFVGVAVLTAVRGGWRWDLAALALLGLVVLARVSLAALGAVLVAAVLAHAVGERPRGAGLRDTSVAVGRRLVREHLLVLLAVGAAVVLAASGLLSGFAGTYGASFDLPLGLLRERLTVEGGQLAIGFAFVPAAGGIAWLGRGLLRAGTPEVRALAFGSLAGLLALTYVNRIGGPEDRYLLPLTALVPVAFAAAMSRRELPRVLTVVVGVWLARAVITQQRLDAPTAEAHLPRPSGAWFSEVLLGRLRLALPVEGWAATALLAVGVAGCVVLVLAPGARWRPRIGAAALAVSVGLGLAGGIWGMHGFTEAQPDRASTFAQATFVDRATGGAAAAPVAWQALADPAIPNAFQRLQAFNASIRSSADFGDRVNWRCCAGFADPTSMAIDGRTGGLRLRGTALPQYLVTVKQWRPAFLAVRPVAAATDGNPPARVERIDQPPRVAWAGLGAEPDGWGVPGRRFEVRVFRAGVLSGVPASATCLRADVVAPPPPAVGELRVRVGSVRLSLPPGGSTAVEVPVPDLSSVPFVDLRVRASRSSVLEDGRRVTVALSDVRTQRCSAATG